MAKHPLSRRVHRTSTDEDKFVSGVLESSVWAKTHGRWLVIAGVVGLVVLAGTVYVRNVRSARAERAAAELTTVRSTVASGNTALAKQDLQNYVNRFGKTPSGGEAKMMLAQVQLENKEPG